MALPLRECPLPTLATTRQPRGNVRNHQVDVTRSPPELLHAFAAFNGFRGRDKLEPQPSTCEQVGLRLGRTRQTLLCHRTMPRRCELIFSNSCCSQPPSRVTTPLLRDAFACKAEDTLLLRVLANSRATVSEVSSQSHLMADNQPGLRDTPKRHRLTVRGKSCTLPQLARREATSLTTSSAQQGRDNLNLTCSLKVRMALKPLLSYTRSHTAAADCTMGVDGCTALHPALPGPRIEVAGAM